MTRNDQLKLFIELNRPHRFWRGAFLKWIPIGLLFLMLTAKVDAQVIAINTEEQLIDIAIKNNLEVKAQALDLKAAKANRVTAFELPKLEANAQIGQYNSVKRDYAYQVAQAIPFPTVFVTKLQLRSAETKAKEWEYSSRINELKLAVRSVYYQIQYLQYHQQKLQQLDSLFDEFIRVAQLRYQAGEAQKLEISTAEAKKGEIDLLNQQNKTNLSNAYRSLQLLLHVTDELKVATVAVFQPLQLSLLSRDSMTVSNHPLLQTYYQQAAILKQTKRVELSQALPDFTVGFTNQSLIGYQTIDGVEKYFNASNRFHVFNVGVAIPLTIGTYQARAKAISYQQQKAEATATYQKEQLTTQLENALEQYQQNNRQYEYYLQKALPNAKEIMKAAQLGYKTGDIDYVAYLYALQTSTDIELKYLQAILQLNQSVITINYLINR